MAFYKLGEFLKDINTQKKNILRDDPDAHKDYSPFVINRILGGFLDTLLHVNQLNIRKFADKQMQYDYLIHAIKKRSRYNKNTPKNNDLNISLIKEYYGYNTERAFEVLPLLSEKQLEKMRESLEKGGRK